MPLRIQKAEAGESSLALHIRFWYQNIDLLCTHIQMETTESFNLHLHSHGKKATLTQKNNVLIWLFSHGGNVSVLFTVLMCYIYTGSACSLARLYAHHLLITIVSCARFIDKGLLIYCICFFNKSHLRCRLYVKHSADLHIADYTLLLNLLLVAFFNTVHDVIENAKIADKSTNNSHEVACFVLVVLVLEKPQKINLLHNFSIFLSFFKRCIWKLCKSFYALIGQHHMWWNM